MTTINDAYINALLADATYAEGLVDGAQGVRLKDLLSSRMTPVLADFIGNNFYVVSHIESSDTFGSGFDATVWKGVDGSPYEGKVYVSMQGTTGLQGIA